MENRQEISAELKEISPLLAEMAPVNPYALPAGYFIELPSAIIEKIRIEAVLQGASGHAYQAPEGYFEGLAGNILAKIQQQPGAASEVRAELEAVAPFLNTLGKQTLYTVPQGYFEQADFATTARNKQKEGGIFNLKMAGRWMQYAAAALVAGVLVTGAFLYSDKNEYAEYEKYTHLDIPAELNKVSEEDLGKYLDNHEHFVTAPEITAPAAQEVADENEPIQALSDEELGQYLKQNAEPAARGLAETNN